MLDIQLAKSDIHNDVYKVKDPPRDSKGRASLASSLRAAAKREEGMSVHTRGEEVLVATSEAGRQALPKIAGRGRTGVSLGDLVAQANSSS